jgi:hypothetical protein
LVQATLEILAGQAYGGQAKPDLKCDPDPNPHTSCTYLHYHYKLCPASD